jgi:hypothetical protein
LASVLLLSVATDFDISRERKILFMFNEFTNGLSPEELAKEINSCSTGKKNAFTPELTEKVKRFAPTAKFFPRFSTKFSERENEGSSNVRSNLTSENSREQFSEFESKLNERIKDICDRQSRFEIEQNHLSSKVSSLESTLRYTLNDSNSSLGKLEKKFDNYRDKVIDNLLNSLLAIVTIALVGAIYFWYVNSYEPDVPAKPRQSKKTLPVSPAPKLAPSRLYKPSGTRFLKKRKTYGFRRNYKNKRRHR